MTRTVRSIKMRSARSLENALAALGSFCWAHARLVILAWLLVTLTAAGLTGRLSDRLLSGTGDIPGSVSSEIDASLRSDFGRSDAQTLFLIFRSPSLDENPSQLSALFTDLDRRLRAIASVERTVNEGEMDDPRLSPKPGSGHIVVIDLKTEGMQLTEQQVPKLRAAVALAFRPVQASHADLERAITGRAALTDDLNRFDAEETAKAEKRALPLTLFILILAFGSAVSSMLPITLALASRTIVVGIVFWLAGSIHVANMVLSVVTMLSVALGIDYSLFLVHRYRRELQRIPAASIEKRELEREERAMRIAMAQSGSAVFYSAVIVAVGIGSLLATPLMQTRSVGLGGLLSVVITLAASLTLVPASLRLLRPSLLAWPTSLSRLTTGERSRAAWLRWARIVEKRPVAAIIVSLGLILILAAPALQTRLGSPESEFLPRELEFSRGMEMLHSMQLKGLLSPLLVVVSDKEGQRALTPERAPLLADFAGRLEQQRAVRLVQGPVAPNRASRGGGTIEEEVGGALQRAAFISHDKSRLLFVIVPAETSTFTELRQLSQGIPDLLKAEGLSAKVGGQAQYYNDFDVAVLASYPLTVGIVLGISALALLLVFWAPLASAKAIVLNLLSVAAGYGAVVLVFQLGYGSSLLGVPAPTEVVPSTVPLIIFCFLFGLSMDYEIFLLSRVRTIFEQTGDNALSVREALADTGSVITSAALIMVAVFGAFAFSREVIVQMIGFGLAAAVFVDAVVIRSTLGPALMQVAGVWNWWPGVPRSAREIQTLPNCPPSDRCEP